MKAYLVEVNWAMFFWVAIFLLNLIATCINAILDTKLRKEIMRQNKLVSEQNNALRTLIVHVCSKGVRDRENARKEETTERNETAEAGAENGDQQA